MYDYFAQHAADARAEVLLGRADAHRHRTARGRDMRSVLAAPLIVAVEGWCHSLTVRRADAAAALSTPTRPVNA